MMMMTLLEALLPHMSHAAHSLVLLNFLACSECQPEATHIALALKASLLYRATNNSERRIKGHGQVGAGTYKYVSAILG